SLSLSLLLSLSPVLLFGCCSYPSLPRPSSALPGFPSPLPSFLSPHQEVPPHAAAAAYDPFSQQQRPTAPLSYDSSFSSDSAGAMTYFPGSMEQAPPTHTSPASSSSS